MTRVADIYNYINEIAPFKNQESWDNSGFLIGNSESQVKRAIAVLDVTSDSLDFALENKINLIVSHHPVIFDPLKSFTDSNLPYRLAENKISVISAHTSYDSAAGGVNDVLAGILECVEIEPVILDGADDTLARKALLKFPMKAPEFARFIKSKLGSIVSYCDAGGEIKSVLFTGGGGKCFIESGAAYQFDAFVTGEANYNCFIDAKENGLCLFTAGHYETEYPAVAALQKRLKDKFDDIQWLDYIQPNPVFYTD